MKSTRRQPLQGPELDRREFSRLALGAPLIVPLSQCRQIPYRGGLTDVEGLKVGHQRLSKRPTGCTVILAEQGAVGGVDVRGSAPGTRETDLLDPLNTVQEVQAVVLAGGSAFGLDCVAGVVRYLEEKKIGFPTGDIAVPIVPAAILYDLGLGDPSLRPDRHTAYRACLNAGSGPVPEGNVGAGSGATVGKMLGRDRAMKGGVGSASVKVGRLVVAALTAVNCAGDVVDPKTGRILAGARSADGAAFANTMETLRQPAAPAPPSGESTTLGVVATNALLDKAAANKVAQMAHDGFARAINPVHTPGDGDTIFALATGEVEEASLTQIGALAAEVTSEAITRAVITAESLSGYPAHCDFVTE